MKKITIVMLFLPLVTTGYLGNCPPDLKYDNTKLQMIRIFEVLQTFADQTIKNSFDKWVSEHQTVETDPEIIDNATKIYFSNFIAVGVDILNFSNLRYITCPFKDYLGPLTIGFENEATNINVSGKIQFFGGQNSSSCNVFFSYFLKRGKHAFDFDYVGSTPDPSYQVSNEDCIFKSLKWDDDELCKGIKKEPHSINENILQATNQRLKEIFRRFVDAVFKSMRNKRYKACDNCRRNETDYYSHFTPRFNTSLFPWVSDDHEVFVDGLDLFDEIDISFNNQEASHTLYMTVENGFARWNIINEKSGQLSRGSLNFRIKLIKNKVASDLGPFLLLEAVGFHEIARISDTNNIEKENERLEALIAKGIEQEFLEVLHNDILDFIQTIRGIVRPFDEPMFKNSFINTESMARTPADSTIFSNIKINSFKLRLENITCNQRNKTKIGTLTYAAIKAEVKVIWNPLENIAINADIEIRNIVVDISLSNNPKDPNEIDFFISGNLNDTDIIIMIAPNGVSLIRDDRIAIGKLISRKFVEIIKDKVKSTATSTFHPILRVCFNTSSGAAQHRSNYLVNKNQYFAVIRDDWINLTSSFSIQPVDIIINGLWNFTFITVQYVEGNVTFHDLRIENVTGVVQQADDSNKPVTSIFRASYLSLTVNHADRNVQVEFSADFNHPTFAQNVTDVKKKIASTVASYIEHSIYAHDSSYSAKVRKSAKEIIKKAILADVPLQYDGTPVIAEKFAQMIKSALIEEHHYSNLSTILPKNISLEMNDTNEPEIKFSKLRISQNTIAAEHICDIFNHSQLKRVFLDQFIQQVTVKILSESSYAIKVEVPCVVNITRIIYRSDGDKFVEEPAQLGIDIEKKNVKVTILGQNETVEAFITHKENFLKEKFMQFTKTILRKAIKPTEFTAWFCKLKFGFDAFLQKHFHSITESVNYAADHFLIYYIKLQGLQNFKLRVRKLSTEFTEYEITATNSTATIFWSYYIGYLPPREPKKTSFKIDKISLVAVSFTRYVSSESRFPDHYEYKFLNLSQLQFFDRSQLQFSDHEYPNTAEKLRKTLEPLILSSIKFTIRDKYLKMSNTNYSNNMAEIP